MPNFFPKIPIDMKLNMLADNDFSIFYTFFLKGRLNKKTINEVETYLKT